jgi:hypothetical protein
VRLLIAAPLTAVALVAVTGVASGDAPAPTARAAAVCRLP